MGSDPISLKTQTPERKKKKKEKKKQPEGPELDPSRINKRRKNNCRPHKN